MMNEIFKLIAESGRTDLMEEWYKIEKKMEVLEIIRKNKDVIFNKRPNYDNVSSDDFFTIKEWLENEIH